MIRMMTTLALAASLAGGAALAQGTASGTTSGTTSGPAAGSQATLGTGNQTGATPHQAESVRNNGGKAVTNETRGQTGGTTGSVVPGVAGAESGHNPAPGQRPQSR
jgi:hypothetical protein